MEVEQPVALHIQPERRLELRRHKGFGQRTLELEFLDANLHFPGLYRPFGFH
jgi:hypothetical protein